MASLQVDLRVSVDLRRLAAQSGCPWTRKQDPDGVREVSGNTARLAPACIHVSGRRPRTWVRHVRRGERPSPAPILEISPRVLLRHLVLLRDGTESPVDKPRSRRSRDIRFASTGSPLQDQVPARLPRSARGAWFFPWLGTIGRSKTNNVCPGPSATASGNASS